MRSEQRKEEERERDLEARGLSAPEEEVELFESAVTLVGRELQQIKMEVEVDAGADAGGIFEAQLLMLKDPLFTGDVEKRIRTKLLSAEKAVRQSVTYLREKFSSLSGDYIRERGEDITDLGSRLIETLRGKHDNLDSMKEGAERERGGIILASRNLAAATIAHFGRKLLAGIVAETGSETSHVAIVARSLGIPAVLGVNNIIQELRGGELILIDGVKGEVTINPFEDEAREAEKLMQSATAETAMSWEPTETIDRHRVQVFANVADLRSVQEASRSGAEGIGLFRTEFLYFDRGSPPDDDELYEVIRKSVRLMRGKTVIVRTLDIGVDKKPTYMQSPEEKNPILGLRGIRFSLRNPSLLESQLSAILRASVEGDIWIMFPMVSTMRELSDAKEILERAKKKAKEKSTPFNPNVKIGMMVETPSAALMTDKFADEADFFSIGTNDLVQYALAADRENENVSAVADPLEPSVLRLIRLTVNNAHIKKRHVGVCGEMAADLDAVPILVGLGLDELSVNPSSIQPVKKMIQSIRFTETEKAAAEVLSMGSAIEIRKYSREMF
jgi:phosphotransferase system enzyme I (PtsI)